MILGIGLDIVEVSRIKKKASDHAFLSRIFTSGEIELFRSRNNSAEVIAGNFAAKEAVMKAFGVGFSSGLYNDIEILRENSGKPYVVLSGSAKTHFESIGGTKVFISISNLKDIACAQAIIEK